MNNESGGGSGLKRRVPWQGIVAVVYGLFAAVACQIVGPGFVFSESYDLMAWVLGGIVVVGLVLSHGEFHRVRKNPDRYRVRVVCGLALVVNYVVAGMCVHEGLVRPWVCERQLRAAVAGATSVRVRSGGLCHREQEKGQVLFEEAGEEAVAGLVDKIRLAPVGEQFTCYCSGNQSIEFYKGDELCTTLTLHCGGSLCWSGGWRTNVRMMPESASSIVKWLRDNGVDDVE